MIGTGLNRVYLPRVTPTRLARLLTLLALLFAPIVMNASHVWAAPGRSAAESNHEAMPAGHCAGLDEPDGDDESRPDADCTIACSALPAIAGLLCDPLPATRTSAPPPASASVRGLHPESDPPPPRA